MIIILHYILFSAGMPAATILQALYLQTYSEGTLTEIGILLMVLPFLSIVVKPIICALADRQQAHREYLIGSLACMMLGYGSLTIAPFYPEFIEKHGRLVWYLDLLGVIVGNSAFGVVWSLGDALAVQRARIKGVSWGSYRVWATLSWGVFGFVIGQVNEVSFLPKYVPGFLILVIATITEILLVSLWSRQHFDMTDNQIVAAQSPDLSNLQVNSSIPQSNSVSKLPDNSNDLNDFQWQTATAHTGNSLNGTLTGSVRTNPRLMSALANIVMEDLGSNLRSSLKIGAPQKRLALADILEQHKIRTGSQAANSPVLARQTSALQQVNMLESQSHAQPSPVSQQSMNRSNSSQDIGESGGGGAGVGVGSSSSVQRRPSGATTTLGRAALRRTQLMLSRMNSLSSATGHAILDDLHASESFGDGVIGAPHQMMIMSSLTSNASLSRAAAARTIGFGPRLSNLKDSPSFDTQRNGATQLAALDESTAVTQQQQQRVAVDPKVVEDLQLVLLKLIIRRNPMIHKYLILFTLMGILLFIHILYFFMHLEQVSRPNGLDFSEVTGYFLVAQSVSEIFSFLFVVPYIMPKLGRTGSFMAISLVFLVRYTYYATYFTHFSPWYAIITETCHGFAYGMVYSLITEIATECVNQVDGFVPELLARGLIQPDLDPQLLKLPLRATMQGLFSGAFDGLGSGLGALFAGIYLDSYSYTQLWALCAYLSLAIAIIYPILQWRDFWPKSNSTPKSKKTNSQW